MTVNKEHIELWCQALESDGYKQCCANLKWQIPGHEPMHCAEGVAMAVAQANGVHVREAQWEWSTMPSAVRDWYGLNGGPALLKLDEGRMTSVLAANDSMRLSFWEIAQGLRAMYLKDE